MGRFQTLNQDKNEILGLIFTNQNLCKLLLVENDTPLNFPNIDNPPLALKGKINTNSYFPTISETGCRLNIIMDNIKPTSSQIFKSSEIHIDIIVHIDIWNIEENIRALLIADELDETLSKSTKLSMGRLESRGASYMDINERFKGYHMTFRSCDFA